LLDDAKRAEFDKEYDAKAAHAIRYAEMNATRQKMRADLEAAEAAAAAATRFSAPSEAEVAPKAHLDAMRQRNAQFCMRVSQNITTQRSAAATVSSEQDRVGGPSTASAETHSRASHTANTKVRLRWAPDTGRAAFALSSEADMPSESALRRLMSRFGAVTKAICRRPGEATVTFAAPDAAARAAVSSPQGFKVSLLKPRLQTAGAAADTAPSINGNSRPASAQRKLQHEPLTADLPRLTADAHLKAQVRDSLRDLRELLRRAHAGAAQPAPS